MRQTERIDGSATERVFRWYIAPLIPQDFDLERHFVERRSLAEVRAKRESVTEELDSNLSSVTSGPARVSFLEEAQLAGSRSTPVDELRARAAHYRKLALALSDPRVISAVRACVRELEAEATLIARMNFSRRIIPSATGAQAESTESFGFSREP